MTSKFGRKLSSGILGAASLTLSAPILLDVPEVTQEQTEWCWAGSTNAVLRYYKTPLKQCEIAEYTRTKATFHDFGSVNCCTAPSGACNYWNYNWGEPGSMQDILQHWGVANKGVGGTLTLAQARTELEAKRPFIVRWAYKTSGGHFIVGHGLTDSSFHYMDPWPGEGLKIAKFAWVVSNSQKDWNGTNVMTTTPVSSTDLTHSSGKDGLGLRLSRNSVEFRLSSDSRVDIEIRDIRGSLVWKLPESYLGVGDHEIGLSTPLPPGAKLVLVRTDSQRSRQVLVTPP